MSSQDSNRLYSWLWDSHISPKNSKWLQQNLSDIDSTVKQMIKIIEEDGDSFAKRAEMYYKRRPELMRLVEQFYRAYRGLAERYFHATGVIRQAHNTMSEAFPDQIPPLMLTEESQAECSSDKVAEHFLGFDDEVMKEGGLVRFEMILGRISALESRLACAEEESTRLKEQAKVEAQLLTEALRRSEGEKEDMVVQYKQCVERISLLETELSQPGDDQVRILKEALAAAEAEKDTILAQHCKSVTMISSLQKKLIYAENESRKISQRADNAEDEVKQLKREISKLEEEKEVASLVYRQSIEKISSRQDEALKLNGEINSASLKLQGAEMRYGLLKDHLKFEMESLMGDMEKVSEENTMLRRSILDLKRALDKSYVESEFGSSYATHGEAMVRDLEGLKEKLRETLENNELLGLEKSVLVMLFGQLRLETTESDKERKSLMENLKAESRKVTALENEVENLLKLNMSVRKDLSELKRRSCVLEDENCTVLVEALSVSNASLVVEGFVAEKTVEVEELAKATRRLENDLEMLKDENMNLRDLLHEKESELAREKARMEEDFSEARETQDAQILKLSSDNSREIANNMFLHKMVKQLETELAVLRNRCEETEAREMALISELENGRTEINDLISKLLISSVREAVFVEKASELSEIRRSTEKEVIVRGLEGENVAQKASLDALVAAVENLRTSFLYFETRARTILERAEEPEENGLCDDGNCELFGGLAKVQDLQNRMKGLEKLIGNIEKLRTYENLPSELKCAIDADTPKDITLDKASKLEQHGRNRTDDRMLELWEIGSEGHSIDLTVSKGSKKVGNIVPEIMVVDKLEISKRFIDSYREENKRKMIEKLDLDGLKLTNLRITVHDLMNKVSMIEVTKKSVSDIEYNTVKEQLQEAEETVTKLSEMNSKLKKAVQDNVKLQPLDGKSESEFEQTWDSRRRKILEHANRGAERVTRLQLEVQKLQFLLLKLDNEQEKKLKARIADTGPKFLLKDYLHGRVRSVKLNGVSQSKKKIFCGCINPPTNGDSPRYTKK